MNRWSVILVAAVLAFAGAGCGENEGEPAGGGGGHGGSGAPGGIGGTGGTGAAGGTGGSGGESAVCVEDADCGAEERCIVVDGAPLCAPMCESDDDCRREGDACMQVGGGAAVCRPMTGDDCNVDTDCAAGDACIDGFCYDDGSCTEDWECDPDQLCEAGSCVGLAEGCETTAECYDQGAYCADLGASFSACLSVACGDDLNGCSRCALGPNDGAADEGGPLLFYPAQEDGCVLDPNRCLPGATPWVCAFSFLAFDPDGDLPATNLGARVRLVGRDGNLLQTFDASVSPTGAFEKYVFTACFPETTSGSIGGAVVLDDDAGNHSQTLCFDGTL